jgi:hypothetical protein
MWERARNMWKRAPSPVQQPQRAHPTTDLAELPTPALSRCALWLSLATGGGLGRWGRRCR